MTPTILSLVRVARSQKCAMKSRFQTSRVSVWRLEEKYGRAVKDWLRVKSGAGGHGRLGEILT
jgi:hypothetical protein